jgi:hypothetical protein
MNEILLRSLHRFWPEVVLTLGLLLVVIVDTTRVRGRDVANWLLTMATLAAAFVLSVRLGTQSGGMFEGMLALDPMGIFFKLVLIGSSLLVVGAFRFDGSRELRGPGPGRVLRPDARGDVLEPAPGRRQRPGHAVPRPGDGLDHRRT